MNFFRVLLPALGSLLLSIPVWAAPEIAGGAPVSAGHPIAKTTVLLAIQAGKQNSICSGSILSSDIILTAAHCLEGATGVRIIFGTTPQAAERITDADVLLVPEVYKKKGVLDIGLLRFSGGLAKSYQRADILNSKHVFSAGERVVVAGYGVTNMKTGKGVGVLRSVVEKIHPENQPGMAEVLLEHVGKTSVCPGDSGGPAFVVQGEKYGLFGVASRIATDDGPCGSMSIYTDIRQPQVMKNLQAMMRLIRAK